MVLFVFVVNATTKTSIKPTDLPKSVTNHITQNYPSHYIKEAFRVNTNNILTYEVIIKGSQDQITLYYDKDGKYLKKEVSLPAKPQMKESSKPSPSRHLVIKK